jgi:hypothetical protein
MMEGRLDMERAQMPNEPDGSQVDVRAQINKRPLSVTLLALIVLIITVINLIRLVLSIRYWSFLSSQSGASPLYLALTGLIWSVAGLSLLWGLWKAKKWAPKLMQAVGLTYALYYWLDHIFLMDRPVTGTTNAFRAMLPINWQFSAGVTVVGLGLMVWTLGREKVKAYFGAADVEATQIQADNHGQG